MKKRFVILTAVILVLAFAACSAPEVLPEPEPTATKPLVQSAATPTPTEAPKLSYTTGLPFEGPYKPVLAVIENSPAARPQTGLQTADIVYEVPVERSITRFLCLFSDNVPDKIMPLRSARIPFLYIQREWDAPFMFFGAAGRKPKLWSKPYSVYGHSLFGDVEFPMDGLEADWKDYYYRTSSAKAPHNVIGNQQMAQALVKDEPTPPGWLFGDSSAASAAACYFGQINLRLCAREDDFVSYTYDEAKDVYLRSMGGKPFLSAETGEQIEVKNIIVQYSTYKEASGRKLWALVGGGKADYYIGGRLIQGTWERASENDNTMFLDSEGQQIVLHPGNTWVHISPEP